MSFFRALLATLNGVFALVASTNQNYPMAIAHIVIMIILCAVRDSD